MWYALGGILVLLVIFVLWRLASVSRGARIRDERILAMLDPLGRKLDNDETVTRDEVHALATHPETRYMLFHALRGLERSDLLPEDFSTPVRQAEAALVYWMMHPNELQDPPEAIEHVEEVQCPINGENAPFHVFRFRMPHEHWAGKEGWLLGLAGPVYPDAEPYAELPGAFSRCDGQDSVTPEELVTWYVDMMKQKGVYT